MTQNSTAYRANNAYRSAAVTVPPLKATVMLFDGAITLLQKAQEAHERKQYEAGHDYLTRATAILRGLSHNINFDRGGQVAERLYQTYNALIMACLLNGMTLLAVQPEQKFIARGAVLILAVWMDVRLSRQAVRG